MHVIRRKVRKWNSGVQPYAYHLRETFRPEGGGTPRERVLYLGQHPGREDLDQRADQVLRDVGYTPAERREILAALRARRDANEGRLIAVRGKPVEWRDPPGRA